MVKKRFKTVRRNEMLWGMACVAPLSIGLLLFLAVPLIYSLYLSLCEYDLFNEPIYVGIQNFERAFSSNETQFWNSVKNAFVMSLGVPISMFVSMITANLLCKKKKGSNLFRIIYFLPTICSAVAVAIMWKRMYDYSYGTMNSIISLFGMENIDWLDREHAVFALIFMGVLFGMGVNIMLYIAAIKNVSKDYYEAAKLDGAGPLRTFFKITFPSISPVSLYILVTGIIGSLQGFTTYQVMTNGEPDNTMMPVLLIFNYSGHDYGAFYGYAAALSLLLGVIIVVITSINFFASKKWVYYES